MLNSKYLAEYQFILSFARLFASRVLSLVLALLLVGGCIVMCFLGSLMARRREDRARPTSDKGVVDAGAQ